MTDPQVLKKVQELTGTGNRDTRAFENSRYFVHLTPYIWPGDVEGAVLSIRTKENDARHDWREFQRIKNELCGPECEGLELYPAESRLMDTANQFYLFVLPPGAQVPCGFEGRTVVAPCENIAQSNQRPWEDGQQPADARNATDADVEKIYRQALKELEEERRRGEDPQPEGDRELHGPGDPDQRAQ